MKQLIELPLFSKYHQGRSYLGKRFTISGLICFSLTLLTLINGNEYAESRREGREGFLKNNSGLTLSASVERRKPNGSHTSGTLRFLQRDESNGKNASSSLVGLSLSKSTREFAPGCENGTLNICMQLIPPRGDDNMGIPSTQRAVENACL